ncbi:putative non-ribosomal peptide synthetase [Stappia aggregata IAM 12614]|uniref:Putative non-ribosomal peptide synthetase n=2 Tax=Roseibium aggregatum TaxID=187304 RepID=A0NTU6_ROSAI|nr:putative non-ribosomal peptide synthetase [Stappia aggregata IAM 12614] [Roseibium aggregatum IAM 12614]
MISMASRESGFQTATAKTATTVVARPDASRLPPEAALDNETGSVRELFARQVQSKPGATALIMPGSVLTFEELDRKANRVAWYLIRRGIGSGNIVALGCAAGPDLVVCLLGVIKAGACYMPLDPAYPRQRLTDMLQDAQPDLILAEQSVAEIVAAADQTQQAVFLGSGALSREIAAQPETAPLGKDLLRGQSGNDPAYLVYTSGSTGRPKGVLGRQAALANRLLWIADALPFAEGERTLFKTSLNFIDGSTELLGALCNGCAVVLAGGNVSADPRRLAEMVEAFAVTRLTVVPSLLASLLEDDCLPGLKGCRTWVTSGEPLPSSLLQRFCDKLPDAWLFNFYGASEAAGDSLWARCDAGWNTGIGNPIRDTRVYLLDDRLQPVTDGEKGELYISGSGLALGYHRQPDKTAERFIASPFGPAGALLYRTGDVARRMPDGSYEFLGRSDHQVKIRGVRVEPGEVAAALDRLPDVSRSAVVSNRRDNGEVYLAAYVVWGTGADRDGPKLMNALAEALPPAFLPSAIVSLDALPLTPNGKLDRAALPDPEWSVGSGASEPQSDLETLICEAFSELLGTRSVSVQDNFFLLGGHSLSAARLAYRLRDRFGVEVEPRQIFDSPTPAELARLIGQAPPRPRRLGSLSRPDKIPLSSAQKRLWFLQRLHPEDTSYNLVYRFRLSGKFDPSVLRQAWLDVIERHEVLRTVYPQDGTGAPYQAIRPDFVSEDLIRIVSLPPDEARSELARQSVRPFDLSSDLPVRVTITTDENGKPETQSVMQLIVHHIAIDGSALRPLLADFETAFAARSNDKAPVWNEPAVQYADFASWQLTWLAEAADQDLGRHLAEVRGELAGAPDCIDLPCAEGQRRNTYWQGDGVAVEIPAELHRKLEELAAETRTSLFMVLQAAMATTLSRLGAGDDIVIGTPVDGRPDSTFEETSGLFVNMLALRSDLSGKPTFRALLAETRSRNLAAYTRRDVPFELVVDEVAPRRDLSFHPVFQVVLALDMAGETVLSLPGLTCAVEDVPVTASKFDLSFDLTAHRGAEGDASGISGRIEFRTDLMDGQVAGNLSRRFIKLLRAAVENPNIRIDDLKIVGSDEASHLAGLCEGGQVKKAAVEMSLPDRFRLLAKQNAAKVALASQTGTLSYAELDGLSDRVARNLIRRGVRPGARVAVFMDRSIELVVVTLAIVKAGGAYVPLNRNDPPNRLQQLVEDTKTHLVLTDAEDAISITFDDVPCVPYCELQEASENESLPNVAAGQIACVLFTSGSTGRPKGIAISHRNIQALALDGCWPEGSHERVLLHSPYAFDASTYEIWTPLMRGQELFVAPPGILDAETIARLVEERHVTAACITTRLFNIIAGEKPEAFKPLRSVLIGGEAASAEALRRATAASPDTRFVNGYGPAEGTTFVTWHAMRTLEESAHKVPIGLPRDNCSVRILDDRLQPVGIGMVGELYLAGDCLTLGYLGRTGLTAERFVADPAGPAGSRMYRTGDLVRWRSDGLLTFVGRADHQVKINGFRIEPQEIENAIGRQPDIGQCTVVVREDRPGEKKLVAYVVGAGAGEPDLERLRERLSETLPAFMVPAHFVLLEHLPFTTNGKLDVKRLPAPEIHSDRAIAPVGQTELDICALFAEVLGLETVGSADNFFALGGDSILSIQLVSRARRAGLVFSAKDVFSNKTPAELATVAQRQQLPEAGTDLKEGWISAKDLGIVKGRYGGLVSTVWPLTGLQSGLLFHALMDAETGEDAYKVQTVVSLDGPVDTDRLEASLQALVARHAPLRAVFCHEGLSDPVQVILSKVELPFEQVDLSKASDPDMELGQLLSEDRKIRFDLAKGPLLRACLVQRPDGGAWLVLTNHHILLDGWSLPVLMRELKEIYEAGGAGVLPPVTPFDRYLGWLQQQDKTAAKAAWKDALSGLEEPTRLAASVYGQSARSSSGSSSSDNSKVLRFDDLLSEEATRSLEALARTLDITLNTVLQGAWSVVLGRICGRDDLLFGTTVSGRPAEISGVETMAGLFINTVPVRAKPVPAASVSGFLKELQSRQAALLPHQHLGLPEIQAEAGLGDLFDTLVVFENYPFSDETQKASQDGLRISGVEVHDQTHYPASLMVVPGKRLQLRLDCREERIGVDLGRSLLGQLCHVLEQMTSRPEAPLGSLEMLTASEREAVQDRWNATRHALPEGDLTELISAKAARFATRQAVVGSTERLTYAELEDRANRLAHLLIRRGIGAEDRVAIALPRSPDMIVALLAVLKSGAAYLPLDPDYPSARIAMMLEDAAPRLVISETATATSMTDGSPDLALLLLDAQATGTELAAMSALSPTNADRRQAIHPAHPAYVIYTSGSTGKPKGVVVTREGLSNLAYAQIDRFAISEQSRVAQFASFSFDAAFSEIVTALVSGAALVIWPRQAFTDPAALKTFMNAERITHITLSPSLLSVMSTTDLPDGCVLVTAGEAISVPEVRRWSDRCCLVNAYGPTEVTVCGSMSLPLTPTQEGDIAPIGLPIWNSGLYVLDQALQPVPNGVAGELYIGGVGLARGYQNLADLTSSRFVADPFAGDGWRMYRTGDLVYRAEDGNLFFLGRSDAQVKVRGRRIEPGEIERVLLERSDVAQCLVSVYSDRKATSRLVAYVIGQEGSEPDVQELLRYCADRLPDYMVPAQIDLLPYLPRLPNGKIDRKALPAPSRPQRVEEARQQSPAEQAVAAAFAETLGISLPTPDDSFFGLGGDSISAIRLVGILRRKGLKASPKDVFDQKTVAKLASVAEKLEAQEGSSLSEIEPDTILPTPILRWFADLGAPSDGFFQSTCLTLPTGADGDFLQAALGAIVHRHAMLRARANNGALDLRIAPTADPADEFPIKRVVLGEAGKEEDLKALLEEEHQSAVEALSLADGKVFSAIWFDCGQVEPGLLLLVAHHLVIDGVSWRILTDDLRKAWDDWSAGKPVTPEPVITSFPVWSRVLQADAHAAARVAEADYWEDLLSASSDCFPAGDLDPEHDTVRTLQSCKSMLGRDETEQVLTRLPALYNCGPQDVLLVALSLAVGAFGASKTGGPCGPVLCDVEGHGREAIGDADLSRTVGWFTSVFPVRLEAERGGGGIKEISEKDLKQLIIATKEQTGKRPDHGLGYGMLRYLNNETSSDLASANKAQIAFNYLGRFQAGADGAWSAAPAFGGLRGGFNPATPLAHMLSVDCQAVEGDKGYCLQAEFGFASRHLSEKNIIEFRKYWEAALIRLAKHGNWSEAGGQSPSDFPLAAVFQADVDLLVQRYGGLVSTVWPLTGLQSGLLFHALMDAETGEDAYKVQTVVSLDSPVDADRLEASLQALVARHAPLRAVFCHEGLSDPVQVILSKVELPFEQVELSKDADPDAELEQLLSEDRKIRFDLAKGPLLRACLVKRPDGGAWLVLTNHHILLDGWSLPVLMRELKEIYEAGGAGVLPPVTPFDRYLGWLQQQDKTAAKAAWKDALSGLEEPTRLAASVYGQSSGSSSSDISTVLRFDDLLSEAATRSLEALARTLDITLNTVLQGAWSVVLGRICGRDDLLFGTTVSGRPAEISGVETMAGLFINTVPVRVKPVPAASVSGFLKDLQSRQAALLPHQHLGLPEIQAEAGHGDLFDTLVVFENYPFSDETHEASQDGLRISGVEVHDQTHYPASLMVVPGKRLLLRLDCREERIGEDLGSSLLEQLCHVLEQMASRPEAPLGSLEMLTASEREAVQDRWNATRHALPEGDLTELISAKAARFATQEAVVGSTERLTYAELEDRANRLAHLLIRRGIGAEDRVAIALPRSPDMIVALLAVLKSGAAYLPLDPDYPSARIAMMLEDASPRLVISETATAQVLTDGVPTSALLLLDAQATGTELAAMSALSPTNADRRQAIHPAHPAYVIYTSGSTGKPKGVVVTREALKNLLCCLSIEIRLRPQDRVLSATTIGFDIAGLELYGPLLVGASALLFEGSQREADRLYDWIGQERPTVMQATPSLWRSLLEVGPLPPLQILVGGEALDSGLAAQLQTAGPVTNVYGPTETTIWSLSASVSDEGSSTPPIGQPLWNSQVYVLDATLQPVADGVSGELYIGGLGLARGYHGRSDLTSDRFVADPFAGGGARMYRTGDMVYRQKTGELVFLGRGDSQVKIRGHRIEPGEIEAAITSMTNIAQAVVVDRPDGVRGSSLVAYVVPVEGAELKTDALRSVLLRNLPDYMVPGAFVVLPELPLTPNGKLNRQALPDPVWKPGEASPATLQETLLCNLFAELLPGTVPGPEDSFFDMGGHSLLAARLKALMEERLGLDVSLRDIFETPTVRGLLSLRQGRKTGLLEPVLQIRRAGSQAPLFCVHPGFGLGWTYAGLASVLPADVPIIALQARGYVGEADLPTSLNEMAADYVESACKLVGTGPVRLLGWSFGGLAAFEMARLFEKSGRKVEFLMLLDSYPMHEGDPLPDLSNRGARGAFLEMIGFDPEGRAPEDTTFEDVRRFLEDNAHPLAGLSRMDFDNMLRIARNNALLAHGYRPGRLTCPLVHYASMDTRRMLGLEADPWENRTTDHFETHALDCTHHEMTSQQALCEIGKGLTAWMNLGDQPFRQTVSKGRLKNVG